jgi:3-hydroxyisobutyrate dehydrogenase
MQTQKIAMLGLGAMGSRVAQNLIGAGHLLTVYNRTKAAAQPLVDRGAVYAVTPRAAVENADIAICMVTDDVASRQIWLDPETGAMSGLRKDAIAIESSTLTIDWTKELATEIVQHGSDFLDIPVVGSRPQAEAGKLIYLAGGEAESLDRVRSVLLDAGSATVHHIGAVGKGMAMKLAVNALFGIQVAGLAELLGFLSQTGITPKQAMTFLGELPVTSLAAKVAGSLMVANDRAPLFPIELVEKDFRYAIQAARSENRSMPVSTAIHHIYQEAIAQGYGGENITGIDRLFI